MQAIISFIVANQGIVAGVGVALLDLVFSLKSDWKSNSVFHFIYLSLQDLMKKQPPQA